MAVRHSLRLKFAFTFALAGLVLVLVHAVAIHQLNRQQEAQRNYISALQDYWLNYYKIRKLTLHDFASGFSLSEKFDYNN